MSKIVTPKFWNRFMRIEEIRHYSKNGKLLWEAYDLPNLLHLDGSRYILRLAFDTDAAETVPDEYFIGFDSRPTIAIDDTLSNIYAEPAANVNGYERQPVSSLTGFNIQDTGSNIKATSSIVTFSAIGGSFGPVTNAFLATTDDNSGVLISSATLTNPRTIASGQTFSLRFSVSLNQCS